MDIEPKTSPRPTEETDRNQEIYKDKMGVGRDRPLSWAEMTRKEYKSANGEMQTLSYATLKRIVEREKLRVLKARAGE